MLRLASLSAPFGFPVRLTTIRGCMDLTMALSLIRWYNERSVDVVEDNEMGMVAAACKMITRNIPGAKT